MVVRKQSGGAGQKAPDVFGEISSFITAQRSKEEEEEGEEKGARKRRGRMEKEGEEEMEVKMVCCVVRSRKGTSIKCR